MADPANRLKERLERLRRVTKQYIVSPSKTYPKSAIMVFGGRAHDNHSHSNYDMIIVIRLRDIEDKLAKAVKSL